ncbi:threonine ammonia-lyase [Magnetospirillum sp. SS-4]|uniref:threonine ammonia-lyase n=1 Tax=Magnetospirillum sp. SS-4 TaxID=2681465 RepID=UPI0013862BF6|nr:threonine ammonia-lyase [Magnetospirillum sp. SS-4]CAA7627520.1 putative Threonine dehydratase [Magnetospirillum sp. SS-4]
MPNQPEPIDDRTPIPIAEIDAAGLALAGAVVRTPLVEAAALSADTGIRLFLKLENLQVTGSFKARGALIRLLALDRAARTAGVVAMSAGNHAQGVAWHARRLGIPATIVMPVTTPFTKVERTESLGASVVLVGDGLAEAQAQAERLVGERGLTLIHPYDDHRVMAGQGTVAAEMLADAPDLDTLVVPVGGGGLIAGIASFVRARHPTVTLIGVQVQGFSPLARKPAADNGGRAQTLAEGIAVKHPGRRTRAIIEALVDDVVTVEETAVEQAVESLLERQKQVAEGAGATPLAAVTSDPGRFAGRKVGLVISGGNIDNRLLSSLLMRGLVRDGRLARLRIEISDAPGTLAKVGALIGAGGGNILEVHHQRLFQDVPVKYAELDVAVETVDAAHLHAMLETLRGAGFPTRLLGTSAVGD